MALHWIKNKGLYSIQSVDSLAGEMVKVAVPVYEMVVEWFIYFQWQYSMCCRYIRFFMWWYNGQCLSRQVYHVVVLHEVVFYVVVQLKMHFQWQCLSWWYSG